LKRRVSNISDIVPQCDTVEARAIPKSKWRNVDNAIRNRDAGDWAGTEDRILTVANHRDIQTAQIRRWNGQSAGGTGVSNEGYADAVSIGGVSELGLRNSRGQQQRSQKDYPFCFLHKSVTFFDGDGGVFGYDADAQSLYPPLLFCISRMIGACGFRCRCQSSLFVLLVVTAENKERLGSSETSNEGLMATSVS
jgi:hypothetical protein